MEAIEPTPLSTGRDAQVHSFEVAGADTHTWAASPFISIYL